MKKILVTRPEGEAEATGAKLEAQGHSVVYASMMAINPVSFEIPDETRTIIVTSKNGARYGLANITNKDRLIFAVAEQTAQVVRDLGFTNVTVGPGTAKDLVPLILDASGGEYKRAFTHLGGNALAYDIPAVLKEAGLDAINTVTYQTQPRRSFSMPVREAMDNGEIDSVLFYSPRTATIFEEAIAENGLANWLEKLDAYCLSSQVGNCLLGQWRSINNAVLPNEQSLFSLLK